MNYLSELNAEQRKAVETSRGPLLILAGAGAGKTKTVTYRILHLIHAGIRPDQILAITFTNKAAKEMRDRVGHLLSRDETTRFESSSRPFISTFHSLGVTILKENAALLGLPRHFSILDKSEAKRIVKNALDEVGLDPKQFDPGKILGIISREKGNMVTLGEFEGRTGREYLGRIIADVWSRYEKKLAEDKALDFDDLLLKTALLLTKNSEVRATYQARWSHVHIDEYQDTNKVQYEIARLLSESHRNLCVVGDADQNIYSWRGADIRNILNFEKDYPEATVVLLEENYRSTQTILSVANEIIKKNKKRKEKNLFTSKGLGEKVGLYDAYDEADEARFVASKCKELITSGVDPREIAVLFRANHQSRVLEEAFLDSNVSYELLGTKFFERKEVRDVLAYLAAAQDQSVLAEVKRIINTPTRGIGKTTVLKLFSEGRDAVTGAVKKKIEDFYALLSKIQMRIQSEKPSEVVKWVIENTGLRAFYDDGTDEGRERVANMEELVSLALKYDALSLEEGIEKLLTDSALASDQDEMKDEVRATRLMTVHASKGLEFKYVFIIGLEDGLFPAKRGEEGALAEDRLEEERRLFYVALTRAREKLYLSYASVRTVFGSRDVHVPSEFIFDIPDEYLVKEERLQGGGRMIYLD